MNLRLIAFALLVLLTACQSRHVESVSFHIKLGGGAAAREDAYRIGVSLAGFTPLLLYDEEKEVLNVALAQKTSFQGIRAALSRNGFRAMAGLQSPSPEFLEQVDCVHRRDCVVEDSTKCSFTLKIAHGDYDKHFDQFSRYVTLGGYPALGVFYNKGESGDVTLSVPFYDQRASGADQLTKAWQRYSHKQENNSKQH